MTRSEAADIVDSQKKFYTQYGNRPVQAGEINDPEKRKVVTTGYISHEQRLKNYLESGQRLAEARAEQYDADYKTDPKNVKRNPLRDRGTDFSDADRFYQRLKERTEAAQKKQHDEYMKAWKVVEQQIKADSANIEPKKAAKKDTTDGQNGVT
jgi:hypothetical protein